MCHKIESSYVLIHQLKHRNSCTIKDLVQKKTLIEETFPSIFIDVSKKSILSSVNCFPEVFSWENDEIHKKKDSNEYFNTPIIDYFDSNIEPSIKEKIEIIIEYS
jgi:hypothetical protein